MFKLKLINKPKMMKLKCNFTFPNIVLANLQEKEIQATKNDIEVKADVPYDGLSKVDIKGYKLNLQEKEVTPTKEVQNVVVDDDYDGLLKVIVERIPDEYIIPSGSIELTENGTYDVTDKASANVDVPIPTLGTKTITQNGIYKASDDDLGGYSKVEVDVQAVSENNAKVITEDSRGSYQRYLNTFIETLPKIRLLDKGNNTGQLFSQVLCEKIEIEAYPARAYGMFAECENLKELVSDISGQYFIGGGSSIVDGCKNLEKWNGILEFGKAFLTSRSENYSDYKLDVSSNTKLTHDSLIDIMNNLYDIKTAGVKPQQLILGATNLEKLSEEEIAIATNKGFNVS